MTSKGLAQRPGRLGWVALGFACLIAGGCGETSLDYAHSSAATNHATPKSTSAPTVAATPAADLPVDKTDTSGNSVTTGTQSSEKTTATTAADNTPLDTKVADASSAAAAPNAAAGTSAVDAATKNADGSNSTEVGKGIVVASATGTAPRKVEVLIKERTFKPEGPDGALRVSFDDIDLLKVLNMDPVTSDAPDKMPAWLKHLHGKQIRIRGFMYPPFEATGISKFIMARDNQICCFGRNPKIYDLITISMKDGLTTDYIQNRPFDVVGTFRIDLGQLDDGTIMALYYIDSARVLEK